jgi:murein DD-endopeptidase MepM/ murein hydrolase activator NlpD
MVQLLKKNKKKVKASKNSLTWESINIILLILVIIRIKIYSPDIKSYLISNNSRPTEQEQVVSNTSTGFIKPFKGNFLVTSPFGYRVHPILKIRRLHTGIDYGLNIGDSVVASNDGCVVHAGSKGGYGLAVVLRHSEEIKTLYAHNSEIKVKLQQCVKKGEVIALAGNTGMSTAPHLHFEIIKNEAPVNPEEFLQKS